MKFEAFCGKNFVMYGNAKRSELEFWKVEMNM
jgi:hypothetical protein